MRFFFSVRTKETSHQELPEVPFRRSPGISSLPLLADNQNSALVNSSSVTKDINPTSDKPACPSGPSAVVVETKLKLVKKVDDSASPRVSDKKRVVYMVQSAQADNGPQISAAAAYSLLPHESTAVGVHSTPALASPLTNGNASKSAKQQQQQQPKEKTAEEGTPRYRSLVEKENAKMKKLMQSLSEEKKLLKLRKREAMKEAASTSTTSSSSSPNTSLKMKITKSDSGLLVVQNSVEEQPKDVLSVIDSVANCDVNDTHKKSLFLQAFELAPKKASLPEKEQLKVS